MFTVEVLACHCHESRLKYDMLYKASWLSSCVVEKISMHPGRRYSLTRLLRGVGPTCFCFLESDMPSVRSSDLGWYDQARGEHIWGLRQFHS